MNAPLKKSDENLSQTKLQKEVLDTGGGQANICGRNADLVGTKMVDLQIFSLEFIYMKKGNKGVELFVARKKGGSEAAGSSLVCNS